jgi:iron complex outermembrane receptor protein
MSKARRGTLYGRWALAAGSSVLALATGAAAADAPAHLEEIVVTARKTSENLQATPIAITAFRSEDLEQRNFHNVADIAQFTPSLHQTPGFAGGNNNVQFFMRGIGQVDNLTTNDPGVGVYLDGVYIARTTGNLLDVPGIEQIEVLRGPQGTLFGKNSIGGAISVTTHRPTGQVRGLAELNVGNYNRVDGKAQIEFPIVADTLAAEAGFVVYNEDGYGHSLVDGREYGDHNSVTGRVALNYIGSDAFTFFLAVDGTHRRENTRPVHLEAVYPVNPTSALPTYLRLVKNNATFTGALIAPNVYDSYTNSDSRNWADFGGISGTAEWKVGGITLKSVSAYRTQKTIFGIDQDATFFELTDQTRTIKASQFTQELQALGTSFDDRVKWVFGGFYMREVSAIEFDRRFQVGLFDVTRTTDNENFTRTHQSTNNWAGFGNATWRITDQLSLTGGVRVTYEKKEVTQVAYLKKRNVSIFRGPGNTILPSNAVIAAAADWTSWTPQATVDYRLTESALLYASYSKGFRSGGFDGRPITGIGKPNAFAPESANSYEVGAKLDLFDRRLRLNTAGYITNYRNLQVSNNIVDPVSGVPVGVTINAGYARIKGVEFETAFVPAEGWQIDGTLSYTDIRFKELPAGNAFPITDVPPNVPKWIASIGAQYRFALGDHGSLTLRADYSHQSKYYNEIANGAVLFGQTTRTEFVSAEPGYGLVNARVTYETPDALWKVAAFVTNLGDVRYKAAGFSNAGFGYTIAYYGPPREWGFTLTRRF